MNEKIKSKILILLFSIEILLIINFLFLKNNLENMTDLMLLLATLLISNIGLFHGIIWSLIASICSVFLFGSYIFFQIVFFNVSSSNFILDYIWLLIFPIVGYTSGYLGNAFTNIMKKNEFYNTNLDSYVTVDIITNFKNSKSFYIDLKQEMDRSKRYQNNLSVILIKIKYLHEFKSIYGINKTNLLLSTISQNILEVSRSSDKKYKIEEDIFALILPNTAVDGANITNNKIKNNIKLISLIENKSFFDIECQTSCLEYSEEIQTPIEFKKSLERELQYDV